MSWFDDKLEKYYVNVLRLLVNGTEIVEYGNEVMISTPFSSLQYSRPRFFDRKEFIIYCMGMYGLTFEECEYIWLDYTTEINDILISEFGISDPSYR
jgi:hypothetical protein